jgi:hypothetical protein
MEFDIILNFKQQKYKMHVKRIYDGPTIERFEVCGGGKTITVQTDYHYIKKNNQRKSPDWKILSGEVKNGAAFALTIREIERYLEDHPELPARKNT